MNEKALDKNLTYKLYTKGHSDEFIYHHVEDIQIKDGFLLIWSFNVLTAIHAIDNVLYLQLVENGYFEEVK